MQIEVFYSYTCEDTYKVFAWFECLQQRGIPLDISWHPFAIEIENEQEWSQPWQTARSELRGFIAAEAARQQNESAFQQFHGFLERAVHEASLELGDEQTILNAAEQAALNMDSFRAALHDPKMAAIAHRSHQRGVEQFKVFGTPTLIFPGGNAIHLELEQVPIPDHATPFFEHIKAVCMDYPYVHQIKRTLQISR